MSHNDKADAIAVVDELALELEDELFSNCPRCGTQYLYAYWDDTTESYIFLHDVKHDLCSACKVTGKQL